jgi:hypothetical protein
VPLCGVHVRKIITIGVEIILSYVIIIPCPDFATYLEGPIADLVVVSRSEYGKRRMGGLGLVMVESGDV